MLFGAVFDIFVGLVYLSIPSALMYVYLSQPDCPMVIRKVFILFGLFSLSCGLVYVIAPFSQNESMFQLLTIIKLLTMLASAFTSAMLFILAPDIFNITKSNALQGLLLDELEYHRDNLNATVNLRTSELIVEKARWQSICEKTPQILWLTSPQGAVEYYNQQWVSYTGAKGGWDNAMHAIDMAQFRDQWDTHHHLGESFITKARLKRSDGEYRWHHISSEPIREPQFNDVIQWCSVAVDIHEAEIVTQMSNEDVNRKQRFLALISHEMRTPLNGILGMASLLGDTQLHSHQIDILKNITLCADQLLSLVNNILDLSKLHSDKMELDVAPFSLNDCMQDAFATVSAQAASRNIAIHCNFNSNVPLEIKGDYLRVRQVLVNLLSNAVKFTHDGGEIHVSAEMRLVNDKSMVCFSVKDNGIGVAAEHLSKLFEVFSQVDSSSTRKFAGTGLGLAISKALVERMHGSIWCESVLGLGAAFYFTIEAIDTPVAGPPSPVLKRIDLSPRPQLPALDLSSDCIPKELVAPRILVVDDTAINLKVVKKMLEGLGFYDLVLAEDGADALAKVQAAEIEAPFDIILMDMEMPVMDGTTSTANIRSLPLAKQPHIIAVTANAFQEDVKRCVDSGMCGHMAKPVKKDGLRLAVEEYVSISTGSKECKCKRCH